MTAGEILPAPLRRAGARVRRYLPSLLLAATSASLAYVVASSLFGRRDAFFAPVAAVVCSGITSGQRLRRAVEIAVGVAVGLSAADLLVRVVGTGAIQLGFAVLVAMALSVAFGARTLMANQAAVAAVLVVALAPSEQAGPFVRLLDALIGGSIAVLLNAGLGRDPLRAARRTASELLAFLEEALLGAATALEAHDDGTAYRALANAQRVANRLGDLDDALATAQESVRLARLRRDVWRRLRPLLLLRARLDLLTSTVQGLCRGAASAARQAHDVDPRFLAAVRDLAAAVREVRSWVLGDAGPQKARASALRAAGRASEALRETDRLTANVLAGHVRSAAVDVLRTTGLDHRTALRALEEAAGPPDQTR